MTLRFGLRSVAVGIAAAALGVIWHAALPPSVAAAAQESAKVDSVFGIMVPTWADTTAVKLFKETVGVGAVVLTKELRSQKPHDPPPRWLVCDGSVLDARKYPDLSKVLGHHFCHPTDGAETCRTPNLGGLFVYDTSQPGQIRLFSKLDVQDGVQEALDNPIADPKGQEANLKFAREDEKDMKLVAYILAQD